jgi:D-cysteine desulfhydrase
LHPHLPPHAAHALAPELAPSRTRSLLAERWPQLRLPFVPLAHAPTPVARVHPALVGRDGVFAKRDDLASPLYGGNKVRRFEYLLADALARGAKTLVTAGGLASTQVVATALFGRALGLRVAAALFDQPVTPFARMALRTAHAAGATLVRGGGYVGTAARGLALRLRAERPYLLLPGASGAIANLGYVEAALELAEQVEARLLPRPDRVLVATGSGGTAAGLAVGFALLGWDTVVTAVRITEPFACNRHTLGWLTRRTARRFEALTGERLSRPPRVEVEGRFLGPGYGHPTAEALSSARRVGDVIGVQGEVTYTGKSFAATEAAAREHPNETLLWWCTLSSAPTGSLATPADVAAAARGGGQAVPGFERCFEADLPT